MKDINRYDKIIIILITLLSAGQFDVGSLLGVGTIGSLQLPRLFAILFVPLLLKSIRNVNTIIIGGAKTFSFVWMTISIVSLAWSLNQIRGIEEVVYYFVHLLLFLEVTVFVSLSNRPLKSLSIGWICAFAITACIAFWELSTGNHLSTSVFTGDELQNYGNGVILTRTFAAATFHNYNDYELFLCYCSPFLIYFINISQNRRDYYIGFFLWAALLLICTVNASRGAIISTAIISIIGLGGVLKNNKQTRWLILLILTPLVLLFIRHSSVIYQNIMLRMTTSSMLDGSSRTETWWNAMRCLENTYFLGTGVGGLIPGMAKYSPSGAVIAPHNAFIEILVEFGLLFFFYFVSKCIKVFKSVRTLEDPKVKVSLICVILSIPFSCIINSLYLLSPDFYVFIASVYVMSKSNFLNLRLQNQ